MSKYGLISAPYFPVFNPNTGKYGPEITPHLDNFHAVISTRENRGHPGNFQNKSASSSSIECPGIFYS